MKSKIILAVLAAFLVMAFASCDFAGGALTGTKWLNSVVSGTDTGVGLKFDSATKVSLQAVALGAWVASGTTYDYTYDTAAKTGKINTIAFSIKGNVLTWMSTDYTYKP